MTSNPMGAGPGKPGFLFFICWQITELTLPANQVGEFRWTTSTQAMIFTSNVRLLFHVR
jgi:hypothetical protein